MANSEGQVARPGLRLEMTGGRVSASRAGNQTFVRRAIALVFTTALLALSGSSIAAASSPQVDQAAAEVQALSQLVDQLNQKLEAATEEYNFARQQWEDTQAAVNKTSADLGQAQEDLMSAQERLNERLVATYKSGGLDTLDVILRVTSISDLIAYFDTLKLINEQEAGLLRQIKAYRAEKEELKARLDSQLQQQQAYKEQTEVARQGVLDQLTKNKEALEGKEAQLAQLQKAEAERQARYAAWLASRPGIVVTLAKKYLGVPYVYGGASPSGFDCSGLVKYVYAQVGISLPHSSQMQYNYGTPVSQSNLKAGDLVFFYTPIHHVGIYIGAGKMIDATGSQVQVSEVFTSNYVGARRLL
jgi:cell wall-associated NlpC family hydrolase/outer membrane murein-binding lipoprotein Lpp